MKSTSYKYYRFIKVVLFCLGLTVTAIAQSRPANEKAFIEQSGGTGWIMLFLVVMAFMGLAFFFWKRSKKGSDKPEFNYDSRYTDYYNNVGYDLDSVDAEKELEWLRKAKNSSAKAAPKIEKKLPKISMPKRETLVSDGIDTREFQERMRKLQYSQLPINSFSMLAASKHYDPLPESDDPSLINAIEQAHDEYEDDEMIRDLALRILTAFRTRNSIDALAQMALYDLSSNLRSKAISILTDFDHESVFEPILLACADPTREVRAAAARGLFRLNFDRADAWKRIVETNDEYRMSHAARAAIESGIVVKSFDRLVHDDLKVAYEAFTLVALLVKAGETKEIFESLRDHRDERVKFALLHVLRVVEDGRTLSGLYELRESNSFPADMSDRIREAIANVEQVAA